MPIRITLLLTTLLLLAGCGGSGQKRSAGDRAKPTYERVFDGTAQVVETSVATEEVDKKPQERTYVLTCVDEDCTEILQRNTGADANSRDGGTWLLERDGDALRATDVLSGSCEEGKAGKFRQELTWEWSAAKHGSRRGELLQDFTGCGRDSTSRTITKMEATPQKRIEIPYMTRDDSAELVAQLNAYESATAPVFDTYNRCQAQLYVAATTAKGSRCIERALATWLAGLRKLGSFLDEAPPKGAPNGCANVWKQQQSTRPLVKHMQAAHADFRRANATGSKLDRAVNVLMPKVIETSGEFHGSLIELPYICVAPGADTERLGTDGVLNFDPSRALVINAPESGSDT